MAELKDKPEHCYASGCPLATTGSGFVLGCGDPAKAKYVAILEAPGRQELQFLLAPPKHYRSVFATQEECDAEIARRKAAYPNIEEKFLRKGVPVVGMTGIALQSWGFPAAGLQREDFFIDNALRCLPPANKQGQHYPTGPDRAKAELSCRYYDRVQQFKPNALVMTLHPAGILREVTPLPLLIKDLEKIRDFRAAGLRVLLTLGGKAASVFARCCDHVVRMRGNYFHLSGDWYERVIERLLARNVEKVKKPRKKKSAEEKAEKKPRKKKDGYKEIEIAGDPLSLPPVKQRRQRKIKSKEPQLI